MRAQGVGLDDFVARLVNRILRRSAAGWPAGPSALVGSASPVAPDPAVAPGEGP